MHHRTALSALALAALILAGCGSSQGLLVDVPEDVTRPVETVGLVRPVEPAPSEAAQTLARLHAEIDEWMGTPYLWGGDDRQGIDCSAFVQNVYADALGVSIPRTTALQRDVGSSIDRDALSIADLVFFRTPKRTNHVGIYVGDGRFAHASTSRGVMISGLDEPYWRDAYRFARRPHSLDVVESESLVEEAQTTLPVVPVEPPPNAPKKRGRRTGW